jgi:serine/threonine-protein kinase
MHPIVQRDRSVASINVGYAGPYRLLNVVNTGQSTQIWQAYDDGNDRFSAVKILLPRFLKDREQSAFLRREWLVGSKLQHDHIIAMYEFASSRGEPYLAMEWFPSLNLKVWIRRGGERLAYYTTRIIEQAADSLAYLHNQGWVHRDVKPDNLLVSEAGDLKLIDFALAVRKATGLARLFGGGRRVQGTRSYMAPEQILGKALDGRADLYSFGCTMHELVAGRPPFTGASSNELLNKHLKNSPPPLEGANRNVTPEFAALVRKTMAKRASRRPASMRDFLDEFRMVRVFKLTPKPPSSENSGAE